MAEVDFVGEMSSRKRKGGAHKDKSKKRKKREPAIEIVESSLSPVEVQSPVEDETGAAVQALLNELNQIDYSTQNMDAFVFGDNNSSEEKETAVTSGEVLDTAEEVEKYLEGEKRKALQARMIYRKPEESNGDYGNVPPVPTRVRWSPTVQNLGYPKNNPARKVQPPPHETDYLVCLCHNVRLEKRVSKGGWHYVKCPKQPSLLFYPEEDAEEYMRQVYRHVHPTMCDKWETLVYYCRQPVTIRQSGSEKNPGRLYVSCSGRKCRFFHWTDLPLTEKYLQWFDEEKDLPQVHGNTWGEPLTEKDLQRLRARKIRRDRLMDMN